MAELRVIQRKIARGAAYGDLSRLLHAIAQRGLDDVFHCPTVQPTTVPKVERSLDHVKQKNCSRSATLKMVMLTIYWPDGPYLAISSLGGLVIGHSFMHHDMNLEVRTVLHEPTLTRP